MALPLRQLLRQFLAHALRTRFHFFVGFAISLSLLAVMAYALLPTYGPAVDQFTFNQNGTNVLSATADFNCDGRPDVVIAGGQYQTLNTFPLTVALANANGTFTNGTSQIFSGAPPQVQWPRKIVIEDFNNDGRPDIFIADQGMDAAPYPGYQNTLVLSTGDCHLVNATANLPQQSDFTVSATAGDIDYDGDVDLYVANTGGAGLIPPQFWMNDGTGHFTVSAGGRLPAAQTDLSQNR